MIFKLASGIATAVFFAATTAPVFAATTVDTSHNGTGSVQIVTVKGGKKLNAGQSNKSAVLNLTGVIHNTGGGSTSGNTGPGKVTQKSGNSTSNVTNATSTGGNTASIANCSCQNGDTNVTTTYNGSHSLQVVTVKNHNTTNVGQSNQSFVLNGTLVVQNTGGLTADDNTGGDVEQTSGNASSTVSNTTTTGYNTLTIN